MKKNLILTFVVLIVMVICFQTSTAQFTIKIPKIGKPKTDPPKTDENPSMPTDVKSDENRPAQTTNQPNLLKDPEPNNVPQILLETLEIKAHNRAEYNPTDIPGWFPQVSFNTFYDPHSPKLRYVAEWTNPNGSLWFSEPLEMDVSGDFPLLQSPYGDGVTEPKAATAAGTYGLKITDSKTSQVIFQGKFKINKMPLTQPSDHKALYYVENDWNLPIGYFGFLRHWTDYDVHTYPMALFWFKGTPDQNQMEGELYFNNQRIATTDKGGMVNAVEKKGEDCYEAPNVCAYSLIFFQWNKFVMNNSSGAGINNPDGWFTNDHPGEYTVKVFYNGDQVREAKFTVDEKGLPARNAFSDQIFLNDYRVIIPVKVMGTLEKWNAASWKTDAFYGNPLKGFVAP